MKKNEEREVFFQLVDLEKMLFICYYIFYFLFFSSFFSHLFFFYIIINQSITKVC